MTRNDKEKLPEAECCTLNNARLKSLNKPMSPSSSPTYFKRRGGEGLLSLVPIPENNVCTEGPRETQRKRPCIYMLLSNV